MKKYKAEKKEISKRLAVIQRNLKKLKKPLLIIIEGYESSGKGYYINELINELDPRSFKVNVFEKTTEEDKRRTFMWRFFINTPKKGEIRIFDRSYYMSVMDDYKKIDRKALKHIEESEKMLVSDGTKIIKFFINISQDLQRKNIEKLSKDENTKFRVTDFDTHQNKHYDKYKEHIDKILKLTDFEYCKWHILNGDDKETASYHMLKIVEKEILEETKNKNVSLEQIDEKVLLNIDLSKRIEKNEYKEKLKVLQKEAKELAYKLYTKKIATVIVFEGWDGAGKGGAIKRLTKKIDPRGYSVIPISAPTKNELAHHYLWRFYKQLPKSGHMTIFDRSWYGRVMVERIEKFATQNEVKRAYNEINAFEDIIKSSKTILIKFFIHIDKQTQLERFEARQSDPLKNYKITDEDWRNRDKWSEYENAINEMIIRTSKYSKWHIIEGNQKYHARIKVLEVFIDAVKKSIAEFN